MDDALLRQLAHRYHTPLYVFDESVIRRQCRRVRAAIAWPHTTCRYACKALTIGAILRIIRAEGFHADASSINEVRRALAAGFLPGEILYTGEGSSELVYRELLDRGVHINCASLDHLHLLGTLAPGAACSVRFNPGEGHGESGKTNTGGPASKHGVYIDEVEEVQRVCARYGLNLRGIHSHIGSGADLEHWLRIKELTLGIARRFPGIAFVNLGGGLPVVYNPATDAPMPLEAWGARLSESMAAFSAELGRPIELQIEPGRYLVAEAGSLIAEVQAVKRTPEFQFVIVNSGLNHNIRPALYGSYHPIRFLSADGRELTGAEQYVVAGYLCESGDIFTVHEDAPAPRPFPRVQVRDLMVMGNTGAYSHSMMSEYNSMNLPASVLVGEHGSIRLIERRGTFEDLIRREVEVYNDEQTHG